MDREGDNKNDEYYVLIQTRSDRKIVKPNSFGQATVIALGILAVNAMISYKLHSQVQ